MGVARSNARNCNVKPRTVPAPAARISQSGSKEYARLATRRSVPLPFGADRALFAWMQAEALHCGSVDFGAINQYLEAFQ